MKNKDGNDPLLIWQVPAELKKKFKIRCLEMGITMQDAIVDMLKKFVK